MVDKNQDGMSSKAGGQRAGNPTQSGSSSQNMSGSAGMNTSSGQQSGNLSGSASQMADKAKEQAKSMASQAAEQGKSAVNQQKDTVAQQVDSVGGAIRSAADRLEQDGQSQAGHYVSMFADQIESFGRQLRNKDANTLIRDMESLSRRAPVAFFAGALVAGFVASRFLKSSAERSPYEYGGGYGGSRMQHSSDDDMGYSWRNEMGEGDHDENIGRNRTGPLDSESGSMMADSAASGTLGGQWGAGTTVAGPEITGIYRPSEAAGANNKSSTPGVELPGSAQPSVTADGKPQPGRPTDAVGGSTKSTSPTEPKKPGGNIYGNR